MLIMTLAYFDRRNKPGIECFTIFQIHQPNIFSKIFSLFLQVLLLLKAAKLMNQVY